MTPKCDKIAISFDISRTTRETENRRSENGGFVVLVLAPPNK